MSTTGANKESPGGTMVHVQDTSGSDSGSSSGTSTSVGQSGHGQQHSSLGQGGQGIQDQTQGHDQSNSGGASSNPLNMKSGASGSSGH